MSRESYSISDLESEAIDSLRDRVLDLIRSGDITNVQEIEDSVSDEVSEIADSSVPIYTYDLLQFACDDLYLATETPEIGMGDEPTVVSIISLNIYERLSNAMFTWLRDEAEDDDAIIAELACIPTYALSLSSNQPNPTQWFITSNKTDLQPYRSNSALRGTFWEAWEASIANAISNDFESIEITWQIDQQDVDRVATYRYEQANPIMGCELPEDFDHRDFHIVAFRSEKARVEELYQRTCSVEATHE